jgi:hypothetical protein
MTVQELVLALRKYPTRSRVDLVILRGDERIYTEASSIGQSKDYLGRVIVEISNEV